MDRQVQGQVRHGLGEAARADLRQPEAARRDSGEYAAHAVAGRPAEVGLAFGRPEEALRARGRGVRRLRRLYRPRDRPRDPGGRGHGQARQHADHLHQRRQRHQRRRHAGGHAEPDDGLQRHSGSPRGRAAAVLRSVGLGQDLPAHVGRVVVGVRHAVQVDQAGGVALRRHAAGHGDLVARPHQGRRRHPHAVPSHDRHRADDPRSHGHPGAGDGQRHRAKAHRRREHGVHVRQGERQCAVEARHAVFRDVRQSRDLSRRLVRLHDAARAALGHGNDQAARRQRLQVGALQPHRGLSRRTTTSPPRIPTSSRSCRRCS